MIIFKRLLRLIPVLLLILVLLLLFGCLSKHHSHTQLSHDDYIIRTDLPKDKYIQSRRLNPSETKIIIKISKYGKRLVDKDYYDTQQLNYSKKPLKIIINSPTINPKLRIKAMKIISRDEHHQEKLDHEIIKLRVDQRFCQKDTKLSSTGIKSNSRDLNKRIKQIGFKDLPN